MAIRQKTTVTLKAEAECPSHSQAVISLRDVQFTIDEPTERGGTNQGPTPTETAVAALVGCTNVIAHKCANSLNVDIGHLSINTACAFDRRGVTLAEEIDIPFQKITLTIRSDGKATQAELDKVATEVNRFCPLSKLFRQAGTEIEEDWQAAV